MSVRRTSAGRLFFAAAVPAVLIVTAALAQATQPQGQEELFRAYLQAGEFAPALALARQVSDPLERDRWLAEIVEAQALAGAKSASLQSAGEIGDDRTGPAPPGCGGRSRPQRRHPAAPPSLTSIR